MTGYTDEQRAILAFPSDLVVSAGAGSGKTRTLVGLYCRLLASPDLARPAGTPPGPREILCLTFTNRAAGELKRRIREALSTDAFAAHAGLDADGASGPDAEQCARWIGDLESAPIYTFHAFCRWLLQRYPLEAGVDPSFAQLTDEESTDLLRQSISELLRRGLRSGDRAAEVAVELQGLAGATADLANLVRALRTAGWGPRQPIVRFESRQLEVAAELDGLAEAVRAAVEAYIAALQSGKPTPKQRQRATTVEAALEEWIESGTDSALNDLLEGVKGWGGDWLKAVRATATSWCAARGELTHNTQIGCWPALAVSAREAYHAARRGRGALDYDDLLLGVRDLLISRDDLRGQIQRRFRAILVDEHQDTNPVQHQILALLAGDEALAGRPGNDDARWFVVGDGQQSIYGFRGAAVTNFQQLIEAAGAWAGHRTLTLNHRSRRELLEFFNAFFPRVLPGGSRRDEIAYLPQRSEREPVGRVSVEFLDPGPLPADKADQPAADAARTAEAEALAARLRAACDPEHPARLILTDPDGGERVARPGDIVILMRKLTTSETYRRALLRAGFDVVVSGGGGFYARQEVFDCLHAIEAALFPTAALPLVAFLRSPMVGLPDDALYLLLRDVEGRGHPRLREHLAQSAIQERIETPARDRLLGALGLLNALQTRADSESPGATLAWLIDRTAYAAVLDALPDRDQRRANLQRLLTQADRAPASGEPLLADWVAALRRRVDAPPGDRDAALPGTPDQLRLMTIHQAKGLEFPVVVAADIGSRAGAGWPRIAFHEEYGVVAQCWDDASEDWSPTRSHMLACETAARAGRAEEARLLYVAATRAEQHLILSASARTGANWLAAVESYLTEGGAAEVERVQRLPLADWRAVFAAGTDRQPFAAPPGEPYREPLPAAPGWYDARTVAAMLAGVPAAAFAGSPGVTDGALTTALLRGAVGHVALERVPLDPATGFDLPAWLTATGVAPPDVARLAKFITDTLWPALRPARQVAREHPFRLHLPGGGVIAGTIDCLWQSADGAWWVWDYKFGAPADGLEDQHEGQLRLYALAAAAALDLSVVRGRLWHVTDGTARDFAWDIADLAALERELPAALAQLSGAP
ncbi:MAG: UvrD-helicase domain-containing protein [Gemmatimonadota bacterium]